MQPDQLDELASRVAVLEAALLQKSGELSRLHATVDMLRRSRAATSIAGTTMLAAALGLGYATFIYAQGAGQTVRAPFVVLGASGNKIMEVQAGGGE
ncbi:MAG: hypothetical protein EPO25_11120, partial [Gammaproteobacteria bacterium]